MSQDSKENWTLWLQVGILLLLALSFKVAMYFVLKANQSRLNDISYFISPQWYAIQEVITVVIVITVGVKIWRSERKRFNSK